MIFTFTTLCLSKQTLQRQVWAPPCPRLAALIHSAPVCYIVYVIWSGFHIIYYLLFLPIIIPSPTQSRGRWCHCHLVSALCPWHQIFTRDGLPGVSRGVAHNNHSRLQRHMDLLFCQDYFSLSPPFPLPSWSQLAIAPSAQAGGRTGYFAPERGRGQHFLPRFFQSCAGYLLVVPLTLSLQALHPGLVWVIVPGRERRLLPAAAQGLAE